MCIGKIHLASQDDLEFKLGKEWSGQLKYGRVTMAKVSGTCCFNLYSALGRSEDNLLKILDASEPTFISDVAIKSMKRVNCPKSQEDY